MWCRLTWLTFFLPRSYIQGLTNVKGGCAGDPMCIDVDIPLLKNIRTGLIDPDTPKSAMKKKSASGKDLELVVRSSHTHTHKYKSLC